MSEKQGSPSRVAGGINREVTLGGNKYLLSQSDKIRKGSDEEKVIIGRRLSMLDSLMQSCAGLPPQMQEMAMKGYTAALTVGCARADEWDSYYNSIWKLAFDLWSAMDPREKIEDASAKNPRERSLLDGVEWCYNIIQDSKTTNEEVQQLRLDLRLVSQQDAVGESSGATQSPVNP